MREKITCILLQAAIAALNAVAGGGCQSVAPNRV